MVTPTTCSAESCEPHACRVRVRVRARVRVSSRARVRVRVRVRGDVGEIWGRYMGDVGEMWGRYRGEPRARPRVDMRSLCAPVPGLG